MKTDARENAIIITGLLSLILGCLWSHAVIYHYAGHTWFSFALCVTSWIVLAGINLAIGYLFWPKQKDKK